MIWQYVEVSWIARIKEGQWGNKMMKISFLEIKWRMPEIHLQQKILDTSREILKKKY